MFCLHCVIKWQLQVVFDRSNFYSYPYGVWPAKWISVEEVEAMFPSSTKKKV